MSWWSRYNLFLDVCETGGGWFVERDGRPVAILSDPHFADMFWYAWQIDVLGEDPAERDALLSDAYWKNELMSRTVFRSREFGTISDGFWAGLEPIRDGRLVMRGLYQPVRQSWPWDWLALRARRWTRGRPA